MKNIFFDFIKQNLSRIACFFLVCLSYSAFIVLYGLPVVAVVYPFLISLVLFAAIMVGQYIKMIKKHNHYKTAAKNTMQAVLSLENTGIEEKDLICLNRQLIEQLKALECESGRQYEEMMQYYTVWAHQIKIPIASMKLILQGQDSEDTRKLFSMLTKIEQYVEMVLVYARLESRDSDYVFKNTDVDSVVRQSVKRFSGDFIMKKLTIDIKPTGITCVSDEKWLLFMIEQIISNSLKYTQRGGISVYSDGKVLCIADTGIGIAKEDLPRVFEKGYTGYNGRTQQTSTGLGLYLCKQVCNKLGYTVTAQSEVGEGTVIKLDLSQKNSVFE